VAWRHLFLNSKLYVINFRSRLFYPDAYSIYKRKIGGGRGGKAGLQYFGKDEVLFPLHGNELMTARPLTWPLRRLSWCLVNALTLILLTWRIWWANNASRWQVGFHSAFQGLNAVLNPICHLLALLGARHIFHVSGLRVKVPYLDFKPSITAMLSHHVPERVTTLRPWATSSAVRVIRNGSAGYSKDPSSSHAFTASLASTARLSVTLVLWRIECDPIYRDSEMLTVLCLDIHWIIGSFRRTNTLCGQNVEFVSVKLVVHIVTTGL